MNLTDGTASAPPQIWDGIRRDFSIGFRILINIFPTVGYRIISSKYAKKRTNTKGGRKKKGDRTKVIFVCF